MSWASEIVDGWSEAVISVSDLDKSVEDYISWTGWQDYGEATTDERLIEAWQLAPGTQSREKLLIHATDRKRWLRLIEIDSENKVQIRPSGRFWDLGGISNLSCRVTSMSETFGALQRAGWVGHHEPVRYEFGPVTVMEVAATGPDSVNFSLVERLEPPLDPSDNFGQVGPIFNSPQIYRSLDEAFSFYCDGLGFAKTLDTTINWAPPGANVFGMPYKLAMELPVRVGIVHPTGTMDGSIELIEAGSMSSHDFASRAVPPNLGLLCLRFPVVDVDEYLARVQAKTGLTLEYLPRLIHLEPFGDVRMAALRTPNGSWLEFFTVCGAKR